MLASPVQILLTALEDQSRGQTAEAEAMCRERVREHPDYAEFNKMILARTPAARWGEADEIAGAAVFLASAAADFITGVTLPVDGGYSIC